MRKLIKRDGEILKMGHEDFLYDMFRWDDYKLNVLHNYNQFDAIHEIPTVLRLRHAHLSSKKAISHSEVLVSSGNVL